MKSECHTFNRTASNKTLLFSLLLGLLLKLQFRVQLADVILEVLLGLLEKAKHEEDLVMHKKWGKDERCSECHYAQFRVITGGKFTSEQIIQQSRCPALMNAVSIELSDPTPNVNNCRYRQRIGFGCECCRG